jgi:hypothetical protein
VINADDFYGYDSFEKMAKFLTTEVADDTYSLIGYQIDRTLSDYGSVSRGVCKVNEEGNMVEINERTEVYFKEDGSVAYKDATGEAPFTKRYPCIYEFLGLYTCCIQAKRTTCSKNL